MTFNSQSPPEEIVFLDDERYKPTVWVKMIKEMNATIQETPQECPICKSSAVYAFTSKHERKIFECSNNCCGHFFTPLMKHDQGICIRGTELERASDESLKTFDERNGRLLKLFQRYLKGASKPIIFLDFGAGNAHISRTFKRVLRDACVIYCLEPNPLCEGFYKKYELIQIRHTDDLPEKVDFIYMIEVIEHVDDPISTFKTLRNILTPKGMVFLSTPIGKKNETLTNAYDTPSHVHFFTERSLNLALKESGFSQIKYRFYPEMYPLQKESNAKKSSLNVVKSFVKSLIGGKSQSDSVSHLVGVTTPCGN